MARANRHLGSDRLPVDVDRSPFEPVTRPSWPRLRLDVLGAVFVGGCAGGYARYAATTHWPAPADRFPWATFGVNVAGAFVLAVLVVVATERAPSRYLRPLVGTGFCGAVTTFSSVVVSADQMFAHDHADTAAVYLLATIVAGLAAAASGLIVARVATAHRRHPSRERSSS